MATPTRILLIDDDAGDSAAIGAALRASGVACDLVEARDVEAGRAAAATQPFDCVLLDGALNGAAALVGEWAAGAAPAAIVLTDAGAEDARAWRDAGAVDAFGRSETDVLVRAVRCLQGRGGWVAELQSAHAEAEAKSRALDRLSRQTTLILSILAHDLRNPFQVILGMSEVLGAGAGDAAATARRAGVLHEAAEQAHALIESLFAWASLHMDARAEATDHSAADLLAECARTIQIAADDKGVRLDVRGADARVRAQGDAVAAILRNLAANALKFTSAGGVVTLTAEPRDARIALGVADTGVGMSQMQAESLFQLETRYSLTGTGGERGGGLGLLLCRDLAEWVGGALEVESELGVGTTFKLLLPAAP